jgi:hypothetical protein
MRRPSSGDHDADVLAALLLQHVDHVLEVLVVAALVGADSDPIGILLDGRAHDVGDAAVVTKVDHFGAACLQQPADHVDGGVMAVEQRCRRHEAQYAAPGGRHLLLEGGSLFSHGHWSISGGELSPRGR